MTVTCIQLFYLNAECDFCGIFLGLVALPQNRQTLQHFERYFRFVYKRLMLFLWLPVMFLFFCFFKTIQLKKVSCDTAETFVPLRRLLLSVRLRDIRETQKKKSRPLFLSPFKRGMASACRTKEPFKNSGMQITWTLLSKQTKLVHSIC